MFGRSSRSALVLSLVLAAWPLGLSAADSDPVVAVVDGQEIHRSDLEEAQTRLPEQLQGYPLEEIYKPLVDSLVNSKLAAKEARRLELQNDPAVQHRLARIQEQVLERALISRMMKQELSEERLRQAYQDLLTKTPPAEEVHARHILVETEAAAQAIITELQNGAEFAKLAQDRSTGPSAGKGGDLGYFAKDEMIPAFSDAAFAMEKGTFSQKPVQTQFGWHVIKVEDRRKATPPTFDKAKPLLERELTETLGTQLIQGLREKAEVRVFSLDGTPLKDEGK